MCIDVVERFCCEESTAIQLGKQAGRDTEDYGRQHPQERAGKRLIFEFVAPALEKYSKQIVFEDRKRSIQRRRGDAFTVRIPRLGRNCFEAQWPNARKYWELFGDHPTWSLV